MSKRNLNGEANDHFQDRPVLGSLDYSANYGKRRGGKPRHYACFACHVHLRLTHEAEAADVIPYDSTMRKTLLLIALAALSFSCKDMREAAKQVKGQMNGLMEFRAQLMKEMNEPEMGVHFNTFTMNGETSTMLRLTFVNSRLNDANKAARQQAAEKAAQFARAHYPGFSTVNEVQVNFQRNSNFLIFHSSMPVDGFSFPVPRADVAPAATRPPDSTTASTPSTAAP